MIELGFDLSKLTDYIPSLDGKDKSLLSAIHNSHPPEWEIIWREDKVTILHKEDCVATFKWELANKIIPILEERYEELKEIKF